jgi:hypothetical protein
LAGPETTYYTSIHRLLPVEDVLHREKMHNAYRSGTADVWYSGSLNDLWVEYKYLRCLPKRKPVCMRELLSAQQLRWLNRRYAEGRHVVAILGSPFNSWIYEAGEWATLDVPSERIVTQGMTRASVADYIMRKTCLSYAYSSRPPKLPPSPTA